MPSNKRLPALPESSAFKRLYLSQNKIRSFGPTTNLLGVPELTELTVAVNRLAEVPPDLGACFKLRSFDCRSCQPSPSICSTKANPPSTTCHRCRCHHHHRRRHHHHHHNHRCHHHHHHHHQNNHLSTNVIKTLPCTLGYLPDLGTLLYSDNPCAQKIGEFDYCELGSRDQKTRARRTANS